ncbi:radical SAM/SPASM domain-containing protein [Paradesulfitobacterium ferrireducens]|uniref:radical SAM/SPASM domain-containing protein n=1 Tax=Paradesulfitobacterium ferrireducens TaxID=2816476 RepID=UPI001A8F3A97|nr:radical SAM protein [Paradesulfitobacterium ferrireducens]
MTEVKSPYVSLSDSVRFRKEYFGGILFDTRTGTMLDVDKGAYLLLELIKTMGVVNINDLDRLWLDVYAKHINQRTVVRIIEKLLALQILVVMPNGLLHQNFNAGFSLKDQTKMMWPTTQFLSAPETVHWAVTFQCDLDCPDCYIRRHQADFTSELDTKEAFTIIDRIADAGVFQLAIGGGEPLLREDIIPLVARAHERKLVVHITTGRYQPEPGALRELAQYIQNLQVGIKQDELLKHPEYEKEKLLHLIDMTGNFGLDLGANLIFSNSTLDEFEHIIESLASAGFKRITLLRYKPPGNLKRWGKEKPEGYTLLEFERKLLKTANDYADIQFRLDCGLAFLERNLPSETALSHGIRGCTAADRILSIAPDGSIYPCSQLVGQDFSGGNILNDNFQSVWLNSEVLHRYRRFRTQKRFKSGQCGQCTAKTHCGGCRVFAEDALGPDPGCPEPILAPGKQRKYDQYELSDIILDIQESIGFTDGGFPYASYDQIKEWLDEENGYGYPKWLLKKSDARREQF